MACSQAPSVPTWGREPGSCPGQGKPAPAPPGARAWPRARAGSPSARCPNIGAQACLTPEARASQSQDEGSHPTTINFIILIIIEGINTKNIIIYIININISTIVQSMNIKNIIICGTNIFIIIESINIYFYYGSKY
jgi:hypothetical protein